MKNEGETSSTDSGILSNPLSFLRSGFFHYGSASLSNRNANGDYWLPRSANINRSDELGFSGGVLRTKSYDNRGNGFAVRCVSNTEWSGGLAPDSICPKGWQLPTYSGDKSFTILINTSYSMNDTETSRDSGILSSPLSFLRSGLFGWRGASLSDRSTYGYFWSLQSTSATYSGALDFGNNRLRLHVGSDHAYGFAVRSEAFLTLFRVLKRIYGFLLETTKEYNRWPVFPESHCIPFD